MKLLCYLAFLPLGIFAQSFTAKETTAFQLQASQVTIIRDNWGIPHIYGHSDADAVFGLLYAQCEDDFKRVEMNYIEKLGRMAEVNGEKELYNDLLIRLVLDSTDAMKDYAASPGWLKKLLNAYADGVNYYLFKHPDTKPVLLKRFKPWYPLLWTDGSIGAINVSTITTTELKNFYGGGHETVTLPNKITELTTGSNGFAIAPSKTESGNAILYINPHVTFYFRPEIQVTSDEGLQAYGAVTWGQFFVYQGFNEHCGWMHTSGYADVADLYAEKIIKKEGHILYEYNGILKPVQQKKIVLRWLSDDHTIQTKTIIAYATHHGPVMAARDGKWISVKANNRSLKGLIQSWQRTKTDDFASYTENMQLLSNTSNNTLFADNKGNIAYWHGNFIPKRDTAYNWTKPVDGSIKATEWKGLHTLDEIVHVYNPESGWIQNCNSTPFTVSGSSSPKKENYPSYMAPDGQNFRGINAAKILATGDHYTLDKIIASGYNTHLAAFDVLVPALSGISENDKINLDSSLSPAVQRLLQWDRNASDTSVATTLAVLWGEKLLPMILKEATDDDEADIVDKTTHFANHATSKVMLQALVEVVTTLVKQHNTWQVSWGDINRYQRLTGNLQETFDDNRSSMPSGFTASTWGCLPSFVSRTYPGTIKRYGFNGNSFICAVEFGKKIKAKSLLAGGESGNVHSPHFNDQAEMYTKGIFKDVLFYKEDVLKHVEKQYHPGE